MTISSGANVVTRYAVESTRGTAETGTGIVFRGTDAAMNVQKNILTSAEIRESGLISDERHGFRTLAGNLAGQLSYGDFDAFLENALRNDWETAPTLGTTGDVGITQATPSAGFAQLDRASGNFTSDGFTAGDLIETSGFSTGANNRLWIVASVGSTTMDVYDAAGNASTEAAASGPTMSTFDRLRYGNSMKTWTVEHDHADLTGAGNRYRLFTGVGVQTMQISITPENMVTLAAQMIGFASGTISSSSTFSGSTAASSNQPFAAFDGALTLNEAAQTAVTALDFSCNNNRSTEAVVGAYTSPDLFEGTAGVTGNLTAFLEDDSPLYSAFLNETENRLLMEFAEPGSGTNRMFLFAPRLKINGGEITPPQNGPTPSSATISALEDSTSGIETSLIIYRS